MSTGFPLQWVHHHHHHHNFFFFISFFFFFFFASKLTLFYFIILFYFFFVLPYFTLLFPYSIRELKNYGAHARSTVSSDPTRCFSLTCVFPPAEKPLCCVCPKPFRPRPLPRSLFFRVVIEPFFSSVLNLGWLCYLRCHLDRGIAFLSAIADLTWWNLIWLLLVFVRPGQRDYFGPALAAF